MRTARASRWRRRPRSRPWGERHSGCPSWNDTTLGRFDTPPGLDALDLHQIHWPDPDAEIEEGWEALAPDDWRRRNGAFQEPRLSRNLALQELLARIGARHGHSAGVAAIAWALRRPEVTGAIVGARRPEQVDGFIAAAELRLTADEVAEVEGFIREHP